MQIFRGNEVTKEKTTSLFRRFFPVGEKPPRNSVYALSKNKMFREKIDGFAGAH